MVTATCGCSNSITYLYLAVSRYQFAAVGTYIMSVSMLWPLCRWMAKDEILIPSVINGS